MNTVRRRAFLLLSILAAGFLAAQLLWHAHEVQEAALVLHEALHSRATLVSQVLRLKGANLMEQVEDYSGRQDMFPTIQTANRRLGAANSAWDLTGKFGSEIWVFDAKGRQISTFGNIGASRRSSFPLPPSAIASLFGAANTRHFFLSTESGIVEIAGAKVHTGPGGSSGFLFAGRLWDRSYLRELSKLTDSHLSIVKGGDFRSARGGRPDAIRFSEKLLAWDGSPVASLRITGSSQAVRGLVRSHRHAVALSVLLALAMLVTIACLFWLLVAKPFRLITTSIDTGDTREIEFLESHHTELGRLARLVHAFLEQKASLESEVAKRSDTELALRQSEEQYRRIVETAAEGICVTDSETKITVANGRLGDLLGYRPEELVGMSALEFIHPASVSAVRAQIARRKKGSRDQYDVRLCRKDGTEVWAIISSAPVPGPAGEYAGSLVMITDITDRRLMEQALRGSERKLRLIAENASDVVFAFDMDRRPLYANPAFQTLTGYPVDELAQGRIVSWVHPEDTTFVASCTERVYSGELSSDVEFRVVTADGVEKWCSGSWGPLFDDAGVQIGIQGRLHDITERKHVEEALRLTQFANDRASDGIFWMGPDGHLLYANDAACLMTGYTRQEFLEMAVWDIDPAFHRDAFHKAWEEVRHTGSARLESTVCAKDGVGVPVELSVNHVDFEGKEYNCVVARDITKRKRAEQALRESESRYRGLVESQTELIVRFDPAGLLTFVNDACCSKLGKDRADLLGCLFTPLVHEDDIPILRNALNMKRESSNRATVEVRHQAQGAWRWIQWELCAIRDDSGRTLEVQGVGRDVTDRREMEEALRASERRFRSVLESEMIGVLFWDGQDRILDANGLLLRMLGYDKDDIAAGLVTWDAITPSEWASAHAVAMQLVRGNGYCPPFEQELLRKDGLRVPVWVGAAAWDEERLSGVCFVLDVTDRKRAEESLSEANGRLSAIIDGSPSPIVVMDTQGIIRSWNPAAERTFGWKEAEALGRRHPIVANDQQGEFDEYLQRVISAGRLTSYEVLRQKKDGSPISLNVSAAAIRDSHGVVTGIVGVAVDISSQKRAEEALRETNARLTTLIQCAPVPIYVVGLDGRVTLWNPAAESTFGWVEDEVLGRTPPHLSAEGYSEFARQCKQVAQAGAAASIEITGGCKDGSHVHLTVSSAPIRDEREAVTAVLCVAVDITGRKHAEEELLKMSLVASKTANAVLIMDASGQIEWANDAFTHMLGYTLEEVLGRAPESVMSGTSPAEATAASPDSVCVPGTPVRHEMMNSTKDGRTIWLDVEITPVVDDNGLPVRYIGIATDITARKKAEEALMRSERQFRAVFDLALDAMLLTDDMGCFVDVNPAACELCGLSREELLKRSVADFLDPGLDFNIVWAGFRQQGTSRHESYMVRPDGQRRLLEVSSSWDVLPGLHLAVLRDITEQKRAAEEAGRLVTAMEQVDEAIVITDLRGVTQYVNPAFERFTGFRRAEAIGRLPMILRRKWHRPEEYKKLWQQLRRGEPWWGHLRHERKDGTFLDEEATICPVRESGGRIVNYVYVFRDVTQQVALEAQLSQAQKLEAVGQLAAGIAHEINTPTQYVGDNTRFLQDSFSSILTALDKYNELVKRAAMEKRWPELLADIEQAKNGLDLTYLSEEIPKAIEQSLEGVDRVTKLVRAMKEFSHPGNQEKTPVDINRAIETTATVARNEWKYVADLETDFDPNLPLVPCLPGDLNQVLLNIIVNAAQAIGEVRGERPEDKGTISVSTRLEGDWIEIRIRDSGPGIPDSIRARIFDPFFTTKQVGKGTGQGLAISRSIIVEKHKGSIGIETEIGKGTTFVIRLPVSSGETGEAKGLKAA